MATQILVGVTSCGRFDLLGRTLESFQKHVGNTFDLTYYIHEDSGQQLPEPFRFEHYSHERIGQIKAIDRIFALALELGIPYVFLLEDDWEFDRPGFMEASMSVLQHEPTISQVWLRYPDDRNKHPVSGLFTTPDRVKYQKLALNYRGVWHGTSFNPGLRRVSDWQKVGPYSSLTTFNPADPLKSEIAVGQAYKAAGFRAATLLTGYCRHIGQNRHVNLPL